MGSIIHSSTIGDKANLEDQIAFTFNNEDTECVEGKKKAWAVFLLCFSAQKNCSQMFFEDYKTIKDKDFSVLNGVRVICMLWMMLGLCYNYMTLFAENSPAQIQIILNNFGAPFILSSVYSMSIFFFLSAFLGFYTLLKHFH